MNASLCSPSLLVKIWVSCVPGIYFTSPLAVVSHKQSSPSRMALIHSLGTLRGWYSNVSLSGLYRYSPSLVAAQIWFSLLMHKWLMFRLPRPCCWLYIFSLFFWGEYRNIPLPWVAIQRSPLASSVISIINASRYLMKVNRWFWGLYRLMPFIDPVQICPLLSLKIE